MVNTQEWLDENYPNKDQVKQIHLDDLANKLDQADELIIENYPNLKKIVRSVLPPPIFNLTKVTIRNCPQLEEISLNRLKDNQELILDNLPNLKEIDCGYNKLTFLNFQSIIVEKLENLYLNNNNFPKQDLSFLSHLVNLKRLWLGGDSQIRKDEGKERTQQGIYNRFTGSLKPLKELTMLKVLDISDTDLDSGLEYLPDSLEKFSCSIYGREDAKVKTIREELEKYRSFFEDYASALQNWRKANFANFIKLLENEAEKKIKKFAFLEELTKENEVTNKKQKEETNKIYSEKFNEEQKKDLWELIKIRGELQEAKKLRKATNKLFKQLVALQQKLEAKWGENFIERTEILFTNLEELYQKESELREQKEKKGKLSSSILQIEDEIRIAKNNTIPANYDTDFVKYSASSKFDDALIAGNYNNFSFGIQDFSSFTHLEKQHTSELKDKLNYVQFQLSETNSRLEEVSRKIVTYESNFFWPRLSLNTPNSLIIFRTQINSFDVLGLFGLYFLRKYWKKHKNLGTFSKGINELQLQKEISESKEKLKLEKEENQSNFSNWTNIHSNFTQELIQSWQDLDFTYSQTQEWINIGLTPQDYQFAHFLKTVKQLIPIEVLNNHNCENLKQEFTQWQEESQNQSKEIILEIEKTKKQLQSYYENSEPILAKVIKNFIEANKLFIKSDEDDELRESVKKLYEKLKSSKSSEEIEQIIENCEKLVGLELLLEKDQQNTETIQAQIIYNPPKNN